MNIRKITGLFLTSGFLISGILNLFPMNNSQNDISIDELLAEGKLVIFERNALAPSANPSQPGFKVARKLPVVITAYSSSIWQTDDTPFITASNKEVADGIIANNLLPFGTKVRIPEVYGDKIFVVEDRMNRKKGSYHFDVWLPSYSEAKNFGVIRTYIEVLEN